MCYPWTLKISQCPRGCQKTDKQSFTAHPKASCTYHGSLFSDWTRRTYWSSVALRRRVGSVGGEGEVRQKQRSLNYDLKPQQQKLCGLRPNKASWNRIAAPWRRRRGCGRWQLVCAVRGLGSEQVPWLRSHKRFPESSLQALSHTCRWCFNPPPPPDWGPPRSRSACGEHTASSLMTTEAKLRRSRSILNRLCIWNVWAGRGRLVLTDGGAGRGG